MDALIVGAGIVGAACAQELASAGLSVGIIEKSEPGFGATAAGMGHILVLDGSEAHQADRLFLSPLACIRSIRSNRVSDHGDIVGWIEQRRNGSDRIAPRFLS